jgi:DNA-directed RNA polymerase specialized sigma24 family protein
MPDVHDTSDYVGSRANPAVSTDLEGKDRDWVTTSQSHSRLRPQPKEPIELNLDQLPKDERRIIKGRMNGLKLAELAKELDVSIATIWRKEKTAIARIRSHHEGNANSRGTERNASPSGNNGLPV